MLKCPECGSDAVGGGQRPDGNSICFECGYDSQTSEFIIEPTPEDKAFDELEAKQNAIHPLLNPDSPHYKMVDDVEAIERMEQMYGVEDLMAWAKVTAMKYRLRIGSKDAVDKEAKKIATYEAYYKYLKAKNVGE